jgi:outer membrane protein assembly factor BamD
MHRVPRYLLLICCLAVLTGCATDTTVRSAQDYFREGEELQASKHYDEAIAFYRRAKETYYSPEMTAQAELRIADTHFKAEKYIEASAAYEEFRRAHPTHEKAPYALYRQAVCAYNQIEGIDTDQTPVTNAVTLFEQYLQKYPGREHAKEAADLLEAARTRQLQYEIYIGRFYLKVDKYAAAIRRLEGALKRFPASAYHDETLYYLGQAYLKAGNRTKGRDLFDRLTREFPASPLVMKASAFLADNY